MIDTTTLLQALPVAIYTTDATGRITFFNEAAATLWGHRPEIGSSRWTGSWKLFWPDGRPMSAEECPMAVALREGRAISGIQAVAERPDGTRVPFMPFPTPIKDEAGRVIGGINLLIDTTDRQQGEITSARLAAIVSSSDDAIISKTLDGVVMSWNTGAERIFGYNAEEMIGQSILRIVPPELQEEETLILARMRRGERIQHYDTIRVKKDGGRIDISLSVSPIRDATGRIVGASKVARDVTDRKRGEALQRLLFDELNHRVKNTLATVQAIATQSLEKAASAGDFVESFNGRVQALARAHDLLVRGKMSGADVSEIVREQVVLGSADAGRIDGSGPLLTLDTRIAVQLALVLHELATNARKHGALSVPAGRLSIRWRVERGTQNELVLEWLESGGPKVKPPSGHGFGTTLIERTLQTNGGKTHLHYAEQGVRCTIRLLLADDKQVTLNRRPDLVDDGTHSVAPVTTSLLDPAPVEVRAKRILLVEDEPLVAMDIEYHLAAFGCETVGPAGTVEAASRLIAEVPCDAALVDANLGGRSVEGLAGALRDKGIPFAFATGYGREGLPRGFSAVPVLTKPFSSGQLRAVLEGLLH